MAGKHKLPRRAVAVLDDAALVAMASNRAFLREFPFLAALAAHRDRGCGGCRARSQQVLAFANARRALAAVSAAQWQRLKDLLHADAVHLRHAHGTRAG